MSEVNESEDAEIPQGESPPDYEAIMDSAVMDADAFDAPRTAGGESGPAEEFSAPQQPKTKRTAMGPVPIANQELFTADGVGRIISQGVNAFYVACEAPPLTEDEDTALRKVAAYYLQVRMPENAGKYQPELLLAFALSTTLVPRLPQVAPKTAPLLARFWAFVTSPFRRGDEA